MVDMKTIIIQNCTFRYGLMKVIINGKEFSVRKYLIIGMANDKPLKIKAKYDNLFSSLYTFEPKDNMLLQISVNWRLFIKPFIVAAIVLVLSLVLVPLVENNRFFPLIIVMAMFIMIIPYIEIFNKYKEFFVIQEVSADNIEEIINNKRLFFFYKRYEIEK